MNYTTIESNFLFDRLIGFIKIDDKDGFISFFESNKKSYKKNSTVEDIVCFCISRNYIDYLRLLIDRGVSLNDCDSFANPILLHAQSLDMVIFLIDNDVSLEKLNSFRVSVDHFMKYKKDIFRFLIKVGFDIDSVISINEHNIKFLLDLNPNMETIKRWFFNASNIKVLRYITEKYPFLCSYVYKGKNTIAHYLDYSVVPISFIEYLIDNGLDINHVDYNGQTMIFYVAFRGRCDIIKLLYERGADINYVNNEGKTAIYYTYYSPPAFDMLKSLGAVNKNETF